MKRFVVVLAAVVLAVSAFAQTKPAAATSEHAKKDITRHRAMAAAHEAAAKCLESGKTEEVCQKELQEACKGLAIGKYCGMRHEH
jgi:type II secretory pathway component PulM